MTLEELIQYWPELLWLLWLLCMIVVAAGYLNESQRDSDELDNWQPIHDDINNHVIDLSTKPRL